LSKKSGSGKQMQMKRETRSVAFSIAATRDVITMECEGVIAESFEQVDYLEKKTPTSCKQIGLKQSSGWQTTQ
jgi:phage FluMu protein Com